MIEKQSFYQPTESMLSDGAEPLIFVEVRETIHFRWKWEMDMLEEIDIQIPNLWWWDRKNSIVNPRINVVGVKSNLENISNVHSIHRVTELTFLNACERWNRGRRLDVTIDSQTKIHSSLSGHAGNHD